MNNTSSKDAGMNSYTFRNWFSLVFTLFSLYLLGDVFYRWDAFKFHSSFSEYLPNVALVSIIWSIVAFSVSLAIWLPMKAFEKVCGYFGLKTRTDHLILFVIVFVLMAAMAWISKKLIWSAAQTSFQLKLIVILFVSCMTILLTWLLRSKAGLWINAIQERINPLIWIFSICLLLSFPLVGYQMWGKSTGNGTPQESTVSGSDINRPNILLVSFDTMTARDMSVFGYHQDTTPFIKKWAETASIFPRTEAESNYTAATTPSMMTGKRTWTHRKYHHDLSALPFKSDTENLALVLKKNGYHNSAFIQNIVTPVSALGISRSVDIAPSVVTFLRPASVEGMIEKYLYLLFAEKFTTYNWIGQDDFIFTIVLRRIDKKLVITEFPPALAFNRFLEVMDRDPRAPFFAWIHLMPPHAPQLPPAPFAGTFNTSQDLRTTKNQLAFRRGEIMPYSSKNLPFPEETRRKIKILRDYYDEFILYCDSQFEDFINKLQKREWSKNTVIIISADHGESFEHDYFLHAPTHLYEQVTNIPLIIKEPGQTRQLIIDNIVEQVDIPATILDLANIPVPSWMEGRSLLPLLRDKELPEKIAISVSLYNNAPTDPITKGAIAVWEGDYKLVHYLESKRSLLFNLNTDPGEMDNLVNKEPLIAQRLLKLIQDNLKQANEKISADE